MRIWLRPVVTGPASPWRVIRPFGMWLRLRGRVWTLCWASLASRSDVHGKVRRVSWWMSCCRRPSDLAFARSLLDVLAPWVSASFIPLVDYKSPLPMRSCMLSQPWYTMMWVCETLVTCNLGTHIARWKWLPCIQWSIMTKIWSSRISFAWMLLRCVC